MKYLRKFNENTSDTTLEMIDDFLLEYSDKWNFRERPVDDHSEERRVFWQKYDGVYSIKKTTTTYFKEPGFPNNSTGYVVSITINIKKSKQKEWTEDMGRFIKRTCRLGFEYDTSVDLIKSDDENGDLITYVLAFYNPKK